MVAIKNLIFAAVAVSAAVIKRDAAQVLKDLETIDSNTKDFTASIKDWNGQLLGALGIQKSEKKLNEAIKQGTSDAQGLSGTVSADEAKAVIDYINNTLEPDVLASVDELIARKGDVQKNGITGIVSSGIATTKSNTDALSSALQDKTPDAEKQAAKDAAAKIDADFEKATSAFGS